MTVKNNILRFYQMLNTDRSFNRTRFSISKDYLIVDFKQVLFVLFLFRCLLNDFYSILILIISIFIFIFLLLFFLLSTHNRIKGLKNRTNHSDHSNDTSRIRRSEVVLSKSNDISPILISLNEDSEHIVANINCQHELINQLLSILFQLILLIFIFLSSLAVYLHPLHILKLRFEHLLYSHLYGFFVIILSFYILSFYVLLQSDLIRCLHFKWKKIDNTSKNSSIQPLAPYIHTRLNYEYNSTPYAEQESMFPSSSSDDSSSIQFSEMEKDTKRVRIVDDYSHDSQRLSTIASDSYTDCRRTLNIKPISSLQNMLYDTLPSLSFEMMSQK